jgi:hypothetical protein
MPAVPRLTPLFQRSFAIHQVRSQIGKGGDKLIPVFLSDDEQRHHGKELEEWRGNHFKTEYLPLVRPFLAVPDLLRRVSDAGLQVAVASSAKKDEVDKYLDIARITDLVDLKTSSDDVDESKPAPDIFEIVLKKLEIEGADAVAIGDTPYDAEAESEDRDHRRALRRVLGEFATKSWMCRDIPRASYAVHPLSKHFARKVDETTGPAVTFGEWCGETLIL